MVQKPKKIVIHIRKYVFQGFLAAIPLSLTIWFVYLIYAFIDSKVMGLVARSMGFRVPGLGIIMLVLILYIVGIITSNVFGKRFVSMIEHVLGRIPILNTTYKIGKQLSSTLSLPEKQVFKKVVLVDYFKKGVWTVGFVTGTVFDEKMNETLLKVFIPTVPNPTTGFLAMIREAETRDPMWTVEEGLKVMISGGIIGPERIKG